MSVRVLTGDCRSLLSTLDAGSVQACVTSPPYFGLRDYGTAKWDGGDTACDHRESKPSRREASVAASTLGGSKETIHGSHVYRADCGRCGARRVDSQIGLEATPDAFVAELVSVFREVWRVLRDDGTLWLNLGDSYAGGGKGGNPPAGAVDRSWQKPPAGYKAKDLMGVPWRVAFALQADGWVLRSEIIWAKPNPMPESVTDRPTKSHEQIFLFSKAKWIGAVQPLPMRDVDAAWLAALVDGEGSICFQNRTSEGAGSPTFSVRLSIVNTNRALLERVTAICGIDGGPGAPSPRTRSTGESGRPIFAWQITNSKAARVIAAIRPYLIAKATQADLALYVQSLNREHKGRGGHTTTKQDSENKSRAAAACSALNHGEPVDIDWFTPVKAGRWEPFTYVYDADAIAEPAAESVVKRGAAGYAVGGSKLDASRNDGDNGARNSFADYVHGRNRRTVWTVATQPYSGAHFATFPPALIEPCILAGSRRGDTVLDPFGGAGTTGLVADRLGRNAILCELNPEYAEMARRRITDDSPLFGDVA
jgi:DNA modification methylase